MPIPIYCIKNCAIIKKARAWFDKHFVWTKGGRRATKAPPDVVARRKAVLEEVRRSAAGKATPGPSAARSQDFLYDENGLPH